MRIWISLWLLIFSVSTHAEIYTCEEDGKKIFSQIPCGKDAKTVSLQGDSRKITIDLTNIPKTADDLCGLARSAWDVALASNRVNKTSNKVAQTRIEGYMRERIANANELRQGGEDVNSFIKPVAMVMQRMVELEPNPSSQMLNDFKDRCTDNVARGLENRQRNYRRSSYQNM